MSLPDFICIGAQKAGTTWLFEMLAQHPSIWLPPLKEVHYFDSLDASDKKKASRRAHISKLAKLLRGKDVTRGSEGRGKAKLLKSLAGDNIFTEEWYQSIFSHPSAKDRLTGEMTPAYLDLDEEVVEKATAMLPQTKFILLVREPFSRNMSQLKMAIARGKNPISDDEEWQKLVDQQFKNRRGAYASSIPNWQKHAGDRLKLFPFSLVKYQPAELLKQIETFLGVPHFDNYADIEEQVHKTKDSTVPDWVVESIKQNSVEDQQYLISTFGQEFYEQTK